MTDLTEGLKEQAKKDRAADLRYQKAYGMTLAEVEALSKSQNDACAICGRPFGEKRGCVDHAHRVSNAKIEVTKAENGSGYFIARAVIGDLVYTRFAETKAQAKQELHTALKRMSVRGMLCFICNRLLMGRLDRVAACTKDTYPVRLENVRNYLMTHDPTHSLLEQA